MSGIPQIDSIAELARFWDTHDLTEFGDEIEEVREPVFDRDNQTVVRIHLRPDEATVLHRIAKSKGVDDTTVVQEWVAEKLRAS